MFKNYLKTAWRNLWKNKVYSTINILGLAIGLAACIIILLFVSYEKSFDDIHKKNIYRLNEVQKFPGMVSSQKVALSMFHMAPTLFKKIPEIKNFTRVNWTEKIRVEYKEKQVFLPWSYNVDSTFLQIFDFEMTKGNRQTALQKPNSVVLTESAAKKIFGNDDGVGKTIKIYSQGDTVNFLVTGTLKDLPQNSQLQFDMLISFNTFYRADWMEWWGGNWLNTYVELKPGTDPKALEKKFPDYLKKYVSRNDGWKFYELFLLPLKEVHAGAADIGLDYINYQKFDKTYTKIFFIIALIVLLIACINFMNLSTARSAERAREVGIRKSVGAYRWQLGTQFLGESIILALISLVLAVIIAEFSLPFVNQLSQRDLHLPFLTSWKVLASLLGGAILIGLISGFYPAVYLSAFQAIKVLKGSIQTGKNKSLMRNVLVVAQFACAIFLMIATVFAARQLNFMRSKDPGFSRDQVITVALNNNTDSKYELLKQELLKNSVIAEVTAAQDQLGSHLDQSGVHFIGSGAKRDLTGTRLIVDRDYLRLYKIPVIVGNDFSTETTKNGREYILNETMAKELLKDEPGKNYDFLIGKQFGFDSAQIIQGTIVGIAKDFNFNSLHNKIETLFILSQNRWGYNTMSLKINGSKADEAIAVLQSVWKKTWPEFPLEYQFLDDHFKEVYRADRQVSGIVGSLAVLAIIISCLGLFGLASYAAERRIKEVGIRKVLGASVQNIVAMLSKDFLKHVLIAALIALPLAYYSIYKWLQDYAYRVEMSWWIFAAAVIIALLIALITVSVMAMKAAVANPVKSLRTE